MLRHSFAWCGAGRFLLLLSLFFMGCAPRVVRTGYTAPVSAQSAQCKLSWQFQSELRPDQAVELGRISVYDSGFSTHCSESAVKKIVRADACGLGASVVDIQEEKSPSVLSSCYEIDARLLALRGPEGQLGTLKSAQTTGTDEAPDDTIRSRHRAMLWGAIGAGIVIGVVTGVAVSVAR